MSAIFYLGSEQVSQSSRQASLLLLTQCAGSRVTVLKGEDQQVILKDRRIIAAAQGTGRDHEGYVVFQSDSGRIWLLDSREGVCRPLSKFSSGRGDVKALSMIEGGVVQVFWCSCKGNLVLMRASLDGSRTPWEVTGIGELLLMMEKSST